MQYLYPEEPPIPEFKKPASSHFFIRINISNQEIGNSLDAFVIFPQIGVGFYSVEVARPFKLRGYK